MRPFLKKFYFNAKDWLPPERENKLKELRRRKNRLIKREERGSYEEAEISELKAKINLLRAPTFDKWLDKTQQSGVLQVAKPHEFQNIPPEEYFVALFSVYLNEALRDAPQFEELFREAYEKHLQNEKVVFLKVIFPSDWNWIQSWPRLFDDFREYLFEREVVKRWSSSELVTEKEFRDGLAHWLYCELVRRGRMKRVLKKKKLFRRYFYGEEAGT